MKWEERWIHVSFFYYEKTEFGYAQHKRSDKHMTIAELLEIVSNKKVLFDNKRKLYGLNNVLVEEWEGEQFIFQLGGYNGIVGMYNYCVEYENDEKTKYRITRRV